MEKLPTYTERYNPSNINRLIMLLLILMFVSISGTFGQQAKNEPPPLKDRLFYGGSFNLQFGTFTDIEFSPIIGLWILPRMNIAVGPNFRFYKVYSSKTTIYGGKAYSEFLFLQDLDNILPIGVHLGLFTHVEYELLSLETEFFQANFDSDRFLTNTLLAGGGIRQQMGKRSSLNLTFLWALNDAGYGIYGNPEIRVSFMF
jgi:hypothetical protein